MRSEVVTRSDVVERLLLYHLAMSWAAQGIMRYSRKGRKVHMVQSEGKSSWVSQRDKPQPCGVLGDPTMDAMRKLVITHEVQPEQIATIRLRAGSNILNPLRYKIAQIELEASSRPRSCWLPLPSTGKPGYMSSPMNSCAVQRSSG